MQMDMTERHEEDSEELTSDYQRRTTKYRQLTTKTNNR